jgi:hypothetical protein
MRGAAVGLSRKSSPHKRGDPITVPTRLFYEQFLPTKKIHNDETRSEPINTLAVKAVSVFSLSRVSGNP